METIAETIPINISRNPGIVENVFVGVDCSPEVRTLLQDLVLERHGNRSHEVPTRTPVAFNIAVDRRNAPAG